MIIWKQMDDFANQFEYTEKDLMVRVVRVQIDENEERWHWQIDRENSNTKIIGNTPILAAAFQQAEEAFELFKQLTDRE